VVLLALVVQAVLAATVVLLYLTLVVTMMTFLTAPK
jgi:hypothetical protein